MTEAHLGHFPGSWGREFPESTPPTPSSSQGTCSPRPDAKCDFHFKLHEQGKTEVYLTHFSRSGGRGRVTAEGESRRSHAVQGQTPDVFSSEA